MSSAGVKENMQEEGREGKAHGIEHGRLRNSACTRQTQQDSAKDGLVGLVPEMQFVRHPQAQGAHHHNLRP